MCGRAMRRQRVHIADVKGGCSSTKTALNRRADEDAFVVRRLLRWGAVRAACVEEREDGCAPFETTIVRLSRIHRPWSGWLTQRRVVSGDAMSLQSNGPRRSCAEHAERG